MAEKERRHQKSENRLNQESIGDIVYHLFEQVIHLESERMSYLRRDIQ